MVGKGANVLVAGARVAGRAVGRGATVWVADGSRVSVRVSVGATVSVGVALGGGAVWVGGGVRLGGALVALG